MAAKADVARASHGLAGVSPGGFGAIVLAGGRARRLGGADKPRLRIGGRSLAAGVATAAHAAGASKIVFVGPPMPDLLTEVAARGRLEVEFTREDPPGAGPIPALRAGLDRLDAAWVLLLAADLPFLTAPHVGELMAGVGAPAGERGAVLADDLGRPQWLTSYWPARELRAALAAYEGSSLRGLLGELPHALVVAKVEPGQPPYWLDCDTPADVKRAERWAGG